MLRALKALHRLEDWLLLCVVLLLVGLSVLQILLRNLDDSGLAWAESASRIIVLWIAMLGAMRASRGGKHIAIDITQHYLRGAAQQLVTRITLLASALICLSVCYYSIEFIEFERQDGNMAFLNVPVWICESIIPFAMAAMGLRFIVQALNPVLLTEQQGSS